MAHHLSLEINHGRYGVHQPQPLRLVNHTLQWRDQHSVPTLGHALKELWKEMPRTNTQRNAMYWLKSRLHADKQVPLQASQRVDWSNSEVRDWVSNIDKLFFSGGLAEHVTIEGLHDYVWKNRSSIGHAQGVWLDQLKQVVAMIEFETYEFDAGFSTKSQKRTMSMHIICHELLHAMFLVYSCRCKQCTDLLGDDGHGPAWVDVAWALQRKLKDIFEYEFSWPKSMPNVKADPLSIGVSAASHVSSSAAQMTSQSRRASRASERPRRHTSRRAR